MRMVTSSPGNRNGAPSSEAGKRGQVFCQRMAAENREIALAQQVASSRVH